MQRATGGWSVRAWTGLSLVLVGVLIAAVGWLGLFSTDPEPGELVAPTAIPTATPSPERMTPTDDPTSVVTPTPTETPTQTPTEAADPTPEATEDTGSGGAEPAGVMSPSGSPVRVQVRNSAGQEIVNAPLQRSYLDANGVLAPPRGIAGWYAEAGWAKPGWPGASIITAHVRYSGTPDVFWNLPSSRAGDVITVTYDSGQVTRFKVVRSEAMHKDQVPRDDSIWDHASPTPLLRLITCDPATPTRSDGHLSGNWVLWADPIES